MTGAEVLRQAPTQIQTLPDRHTDFSFEVTVESWWFVAVLVAIGGAAAFIYSRRRMR